MPTIDQLLAENDSLHFKIGRLEQQLKYHREFFVILNKVKKSKAEDEKAYELFHLLNDLQEHGE
jgi:hypothetical protein